MKKIDFTDQQLKEFQDELYMGSRVCWKIETGEILVFYDHEHLDLFGNDFAEEWIDDEDEMDDEEEVDDKDEMDDEQEVDDVEKMEDNELYLDYKRMRALEKEVDENADDYFELRKMSSREAFLMMRSFADQIGDASTKARLLFALELKKPFAQFFKVVDNSGNVRDEWFKYRDRMRLEHLRMQCNEYNELLDDVEEDETEE